jgi:hypothetical protein
LVIDHKKQDDGLEESRDDEERRGGDLDGVEQSVDETEKKFGDSSDEIDSNDAAIIVN